MNTVTASFDTTVRQMTEMSQQKIDRNVSAKTVMHLCIISKTGPLYFAIAIQSFIPEIKLIFSICLGIRFCVEVIFTL